MKAQPMKQLPDGSKVFCEPSEATHIWIRLLGPHENRFLPVILKGSRRDHEGPVWTWNGDTEKPTIKPSVLTWTDTTRCHTWITDGQSIFLDDCTHEFAGKTLDLLDIE